MKGKITILIVLCCLIAIGDTRLSGQDQVGEYSVISKTEIELLLADIAKTNPETLERFANDPDAKKKQIEDLKQLLAFASQAQRDGLASDPINKQELENIRAEVAAIRYDKEVNKGKTPMPLFGYITDAMVSAYWAGKEIAGQRVHEAEFNDFLKTKTTLVRAGNPEMKDREFSEDEKQQARDTFAKIRIYKSEYDQKVTRGTLSKQFVDTTNLQIKLQGAQFLARLYSEKVADRTEAKDADVAKYIAAHPELEIAKKRAKAQGILDRAKAGENFASLANEFSEDPGNVGPAGKGNGGLYKDVPRGRMSPLFEAAALALQPSQISRELVETDYGFHIIKRERRTNATVSQAAETYDVRHILISTGYTDPDDPTARETPVKEYVRGKIEKDNEKKLAAEIIVANNIQVPDDFAVPAVVTEQQPKAVEKKPAIKKRPVTKNR